MLKGQDIICFSSKEWVNYSKTSKQYLMEILSRHNRVLYVETTGSRTVGFNQSHLGRIGKRLTKWLQGPLRPKELDDQHHLLVYSPIVIPNLDHEWIVGINNQILLGVLKKYMKEWKFKRPILWFYLPTAVGLVGKLNEKAVVYHAVDEWSTYPGFRSPVFSRLDEKLFRKANIVFATNRLLLENKKPFNANIHFMPHGVNVEDFERPVTEGKPLPEDIQNFKGPVLAMIGGLSEWIDWDLLLYLAGRHPDWNIILMGSQGYDVEMEKIQGSPNIHYLGRKDYKDLPDYYRRIDVCLVSFKRTPHIEYCCPTRFYEHLAAGKPVVSTDFPAAREFGEEYIRIGKNKEEFERQVMKALLDKGPEIVEKRKKLAADNTWLKRAEAMSELIGNLKSK